MKNYHVIACVIATVCLLFYPSEHRILDIVIRNPQAFEPASARTANTIAIPLVKEGTAPPRVSARAVYVVDLKTFTPLFVRNPEERLYPASTTKMITALTTMRLMSPSEIVSVKVGTREGQLMGLVPGERLSVEHLLYGILVHSANDAAYALAMARFPYDEFVAEMNKTAQRLGMRGSNFTNPAGFDEPEMRTTARDLALAARAVLRDPLLRKIVSTKEITVLDEDYKYTHRLTNVNQLLGTIEGLGGIKTGYTEAAGENLVSYFKTPFSNHEYIIVVLKSSNRFADTQTLTQWLTFHIEHIQL
jgi:D-alanyl-D-alanine carboxypeptidase (penicillin-binding protein 5/6)